MLQVFLRASGSLAVVCLKYQSLCFLIATDSRHTLILRHMTCDFRSPDPFLFSCFAPKLSTTRGNVLLISRFRICYAAEPKSRENRPRSPSLKVQVPNNYILTPNLYHNHYYPKPKYLIVGSSDPYGLPGTVRRLRL